MEQQTSSRVFCRIPALLEMRQTVSLSRSMYLEEWLISSAVTGGVIHVIDHFLIPPQNITETAVQANLTAAVGAITKAKLGSALDSLSDVTVFVPDNEAFQGIGNLLANLSETDLTSILEYHVVNGTVGCKSPCEAPREPDGQLRILGLVSHSRADVYSPSFSLHCETMLTLSSSGNR